MLLFVLCCLQVIAIKLTDEVLVPSELFETFIEEHQVNISYCKRLIIAALW